MSITKFDEMECEIWRWNEFNAEWHIQADNFAKNAKKN